MLAMMPATFLQVGDDFGLEGRLEQNRWALVFGWICRSEALSGRALFRVALRPMAWVSKHQGREGHRGRFFQILPAESAKAL